jgi:hypothetical protein
MRLRAACFVTIAALAACTDDAPTFQDPIAQPDQGGELDQGINDPPDHASRPDLEVAQPDAAPDLVEEPDLAPDMAQPSAEGLAQSLSITAIDAYQSIRVPLFGGEPVADPAPLIAGRETLVRVFVAPQPGSSPVEVTAEVSVTGGQAPLLLRDTRTLTRASTQAALDSTFHVTIPAGVLTDASALSVRLTVEQGGATVAAGAMHPAAWPAERSSAPLAARDEVGPLRIMIVPLRYDYDGSGRMPDTSPEHLARFHDLIAALYPATEVQLSVHDTIGWDGSVRFGNINQMLVQLKEDEQADDDLYYYAVIRPTETFSQYCGRSCTTGQSFTTSDNADGVYRVGSGLGFPDEDRAWTLAHELGHMHGRGHAPCDVSFWSADGDYPHSGGLVGVWGWDARDGSLKDPADIADVMGYCDDQWVSDYTYMGFFERALRVAGRRALRLARPAAPWRFLSIDARGQARWGRAVTLRSAATGETTRLRMFDRAGAMVGELDVPRIAADHDGGVDVLIPALPDAVTFVEVLGRKVARGR